MWVEPHYPWLHNGSHRPPPYFEWWYLHFVTPESLSLNVVLHETDIFGRHSSPYLSLSLWRPDQPAQYFKRGLAPETILRTSRCLRVGEGLLTEGRYSTFFDIVFPGQVRFRGELVKLAPPLTFGNATLLEDIPSSRASYWAVAVPHATFTAQLHLEGEVHNVHGTAYQDHQWGTLPLQEIVSDWVWGHFSNVELAAMFFQIRTQRGQLIQRVGVTAAGDRFTDTSLESDFLDTLSAASSPAAHGSKVDIGFFKHNLRLAFEVSPTSLMRCRDAEAVGEQVVTYLRWAAAGRYQDACAVHDVYGISEYIRVRPGAYEGFSEPEHRQHRFRDHHRD